MTNRLVKLSAIFHAIFQKIRQLLIDAYLNDKREFIEGCVSIGISLVIVLAGFFYVVLPMPIIPKANHFESPLEVLKSMKPFFLHFLALLGDMVFLIAGKVTFHTYIHPIFSLIIRVRNHIEFIKKSQRQMTQ